MNWKRKVMTMVVLVATLLTVGVAAMPNTLSSPTVFVIAEPENSMTKRRGSVTSVVRTWATPDPGASGSIRCAIIGLIAQRTMRRKSQLPGATPRKPTAFKDLATVSGTTG